VLDVLDGFPETAGVLDSPAPEGDELDGRYDELEEELGDLLFQICFHARLASEAGRFTLADVARRIHDKLVGRHPHVFGLVEAETPDAVVANWEQIKQAEKGRASAFDGISRSLPALAYAAKVLDRARRAGFGAEARRSIGEERHDGETPDAAVGRRLLDLVVECADLGIEAEGALRRAASELLEHFEGSEADGAS
jgi:tetrapyrrole methylase family protein / MazG family protein